MPYTKNTRLHLILKRWSKYLSLTVIGISSLALLGWLFNVSLLKHPFPGFVAMNPVTSILFILSGFTIMFIVSDTEKRQHTLLITATSSLITGTGTLVFLGTLFHFDPWIDTVLFSSQLKDDLINNVSNRMAPNTAFNFILTGAGLLLINSLNERKNIYGQLLAFLTFFIGMLSLMGYLYQVDKFYGIMQFIPMAIHTAICFLLLSIAVLSSFPDKGIMKNFTSQYSGSTSARFMIPVAIIIPALLGYLRLLGQWSNLYSSEFGAAILVISLIIILIIMIWYNAYSMNKRDVLREQAETKTKETNNFLNTILDNIPNMIFVKDGKELRFVKFNKAGEQLLGLSSEDLIGKNDYDFFPKDQADFFTSKDMEVLLKGDLLDIPEEPIQTKTGERWLHTKKIPVILNNNKFLIGISEDITEKRKYESQLIKINAELEAKVEERTKEIISNEKRFRSMIENTSDVVCLLDENNQILYVNPAIEHITGFTPDELTTKGFNLIHPDDVEDSKVFYSKMLANPGIPIHRKTRLQHKNGRTIWIEGYNINLLHDENLKAVVSNFHDITERKLAEEKLKESEKLFRSIVLNIPKSLVIVIDKDHKFLIVEGDIMESLGYKKQDYEGKHPTEIASLENYERSKPLYDRVFKGEHFSVERSSELGDYIIHFVPMEDDNGTVESALIIALDITEIKKAQREVAELNRDLEKKVLDRTEQLTSVNKELESFSYSVSHDLRAPLRAINGYAKMIEEDYGSHLDEEGKRLLTNVQYNAQRMGNLIDDLLAFSRLGRKDLQKTEININELVNATLSDLEKSIEHHAKIEFGELHNSKGDYSLMSQVFYNLLSNAVKYSSKKENPLIIISSKKTNDEVIYCIKDNGVGFDMKYVGKLFGIFQRLHSSEEFEGTGVGLAIVQRIISKHGGKVWAEGKTGEGASFFFSLPLTK